MIRTMDAVEHIRAAGSAEHIAAQLSKFAAQSGYESWHIAKASSNDAALEVRKVLAVWPQAWIEQYDHQRLGRDDAILRSCKALKRPFRWSDIRITAGPSKRVMAIAEADFKMSDGFCVPYFGIDGYQGAISFAGKKVDHTRPRELSLEVVAIFAFHRLNEVRAAEPCDMRLTARQREVLQWVAAGKTAWDTASILRISEETVRTTVKAAMVRLNVHTRAQAVAEALRLREISP